MSWTEFVALVGHIAWPSTIVGLCLLARKPLIEILAALANRVSDRRSDVSITKSGIEIKAISAELERLPEARQHQTTKALPPTTQWQHKRAEEYARTNGYMLAHVYRRSLEPDQEFDIFIFVVQHQKGTTTPPKRDFTEIEKAEFFFGGSWGNEVFVAENTGGVIGVRTHAWGTFLATCRITFKDTNILPVVLYRYVDFSLDTKQSGDD
jgi:hypothetical protein